MRTTIRLANKLYNIGVSKKDKPTHDEQIEGDSVKDEHLLPYCL